MPILLTITEITGQATDAYLRSTSESMEYSRYKSQNNNAGGIRPTYTEDSLQFSVVREQQLESDLKFVQTIESGLRVDMGEPLPGRIFSFRVGNLTVAGGIELASGASVAATASFRGERPGYPLQGSSGGSALYEVHEEQQTTILRVLRPKASSRFGALDRLNKEPSSLVFLGVQDPDFDVLFETTDFLLQQVDITQSDRNQIVETTEDEAFLITHGPRVDVFRYTGVLINLANFPWKTAWASNFEKWFRAHRLAERKAFCQLLVGDEMHEGYMLDLNQSLTAVQPNEVPFSFNMLVRRRTLLTSDIRVTGDTETHRFAQASGDATGETVVVRADPNVPSLAIARARDLAIDRETGNVKAPAGNFILDI